MTDPKTKGKPGMKHSRTPWALKLRPEMKPAVVADPRGRGKILLPTPLLVAEEMSKLSEGDLLSVSELRQRLAHRFKADLTCPLMTGIFYNIIAGAAEDSLRDGKSPLAPWWRVIRDDGSLSPKTPSGPERQAEHLREEGHAVVHRRAKLAVSGFSRTL